MPDKILVEPDDVSYHMRQLELDEKTDKLQLELAEKNKEFKLKLNELADDQTGKGGISKQLRGHFDEKNVYMDQKRKVLEAIEQINKEINSLEKDRTAQRKQTHPVYNTPDSLTKGVKELEKRLTTSSLSNKEEKELIAQIEKI